MKHTNPIPISAIVIGERQRLDLGDLSSLMSSIKENGTIQPIVLDDSGGDAPRLVAGRRRLECAIQLGHKELFHGSICNPKKLGYLFPGEILDEKRRQLIELEEDVHRKDRTWQERVLAISKIHLMKWAENAEQSIAWGQKQTADLLKISTGKLSYTLQIAKEIRREPDGPVAKAETYTAAWQILLDRSIDEVRKYQEEKRGSVVVTPTTQGEPSSNTIFDVTDEQIDFDAAPDEPTIINISAMLFNGRFDDIAPEEFPADYFHCAFLEDVSGFDLKQLNRVLLADAYVLANDYDIELESLFSMMPWQVWWNKLGLAPNDRWPFQDNVSDFFIFAKGNPTPTFHSNTSVFSANVPEDGSLPETLLEFLLRPIAPVGKCVLMPCGGPIVSIARLGRWPVCFEPDKEKHARNVEALKTYYSETIPNVEFV